MEQIIVQVDRDFARFGSKSYAIRQINSVDVRWEHPYGQGAIATFVLLAVVSLAFGAVAIFLVPLFGFLAFWAWKRSKIVEYKLFLTTSSSEAQALVSRDREHILGIRADIERAIAGTLG